MTILPNISDEHSVKVKEIWNTLLKTRNYTKGI